MFVVNSNLTLSTSLVSLPSGGPTEGSGGGAAAVGEEDFRGGENEAAGARREKESCGCSGETSKSVKIKSAVFIFRFCLQRETKIVSRLTDTK